jgi:hypothetical protein
MATVNGDVSPVSVYHGRCVILEAEIRKCVAVLFGGGGGSSSKEVT